MRCRMLLCMNNSDIPSIFLTSGGVGHRLGVSPSRAVQYDKEGVLPATARDSSGRRLWTIEAVERFAQERQARAAARTAAEETLDRVDRGQTKADSAGVSM